MSAFERDSFEHHSRDILAERARQLARPLATVGPSRTPEFVRFELAGERFAIETALIHRIDRLPKVSSIPCLPDYFVGVVNFYGEILPVIDLCPLLNLQTSAGADRRRIIVLGFTGPELGLVIDADGEIAQVALGERLDAALSHSSQPFVRQITDDVVVILDGSALLRDARLTIARNPSLGAAEVQQ